MTINNKKPHVLGTTKRIESNTYPLIFSSPTSIINAKKERPEWFLFY